MSHHMTCPLCDWVATPENSREVGIIRAMMEHREREHVRYRVILRCACGHERGSHYSKRGPCSYCVCGGFLLEVELLGEYEVPA